MGFRVGVDVGGSFTDFAVLDEADHTIHALKVLSRPDDPGAEVLTGIRLLQEKQGINPEEISYFTHGTTVGVNAVIQRKGIRLALLTTRNFEDVLELARLKIPQMHNMFSQRPSPLISRDLVFSVEERIDERGQMLKPVDREGVLRALRD